MFERLSKRIRLTEEGEILFDITEKFFNDLENMKRIYADMQSGKIGNLSIAASSGIMAYVFPRTINIFKKKFPGINLKLITSMSNFDILSLLSRGEIDFGVGIQSNHVLHKKIIFLLWKSFDPFLITPKDHPLSHKKNIKLVDIAAYPHILFRKESNLRNVIDETYARNKIDHKMVIEVDVAANLKSYVEMDIGVGVLSSSTILPQDKKKFFLANLSKIFGKVNVGIYYRKDKYISNAMKIFLKLFCPELLDSFISFNVEPQLSQKIRRILSDPSLLKGKTRCHPPFINGD